MEILYWIIIAFFCCFTSFGLLLAVFYLSQNKPLFVVYLILLIIGLVVFEAFPYIMPLLSSEYFYTTRDIMLGSFLIFVGFAIQLWIICWLYHDTHVANTRIYCCDKCGGQLKEVVSKDALIRHNTINGGKIFKLTYKASCPTHGLRSIWHDYVNNDEHPVL